MSSDVGPGASRWRRARRSHLRSRHGCDELVPRHRRPSPTERIGYSIPSSRDRAAFGARIAICPIIRLGRVGLPSTHVTVIDTTLYTDAACPWAYSANPALRVLEWRFGDQLSWRLVMIGLRDEVSDAARAHLRSRPAACTAT